MKKVKKKYFNFIQEMFFEKLKKIGRAEMSKKMKKGEQKMFQIFFT